MTELPDDPKRSAGAAKCPLQLLPPGAIHQAAWVLQLGAQKYGAWNWRSAEILGSTYVAAAMRHLMAWWDGELTDPESGRSHLAHVAACMLIALDAEEHGTLALDHPPTKPTP